MVPSLGRGAADFVELADRLADEGFRAVALNPRGVDGSGGLHSRLDLHRLAADVIAVAGWMGGGAVHLVGHGFGQRVVRCAASSGPDSALSLVLLAAGGLVDPPDSVAVAQARVVFSHMPEPERLALISQLFFAAGNDAISWHEGWWPAAATAQALATRRTPVQEWFGPTGHPVLVVQPQEDSLVPSQNGSLLVEALGRGACLVEVPGAGHALLPEQPTLVADAIIGFLSRVETEVHSLQG